MIFDVVRVQSMETRRQNVVYGLFENNLLYLHKMNWHVSVCVRTKWQGLVHELMIARVRANVIN